MGAFFRGCFHFIFYTDSINAAFPPGVVLASGDFSEIAAIKAHWDRKLSLHKSPPSGPGALTDVSDSAFGEEETVIFR